MNSSLKPLPAKAGCLRVTEHYLCEEGEGSTLGALTYLVRLSGCNLRCWWCDSKFSSFREDEAKDLASVELEKAALESGALWISFTGGEPTWRGPEELETLAQLCFRLRRAGKKVKIESNGLLLPAVLTDAADLWSLAPKWDGSKEYAEQKQDAMDFDIPMLKEFQRIFAPQRLQMKFVVDSKDNEPLADDLKRAKSILKELGQGERFRVFFIPQAYAAGEYLERCKKLGLALQAMAPSLPGWDLRVQPQWHRVLYGDARGK